MREVRRTGQRTRRAAIVDESVLQRSRIGQLLADDVGVELVHVSASLRDFMAWLSSADRGRWPHLLALHVPSDADATAQARAVSALRTAGIRVLLVAPPSSRVVVRKLRDGGIDGIVSTTDGESEFISAANSVLAGAPLVTANARTLIDGSRNTARLSAQEQRVLALYASGLTIADVAIAIGVRHDTARKYLDRVRDKYTAAGRPARSKLELARIAWSEGLLDSDLPTGSSETG
ncbi:helix-turn-helix transcriptional regulator [Microbacterium sp. NPDC055903]